MEGGEEQRKTNSKTCTEKVERCREAIDSNVLKTYLQCNLPEMDDGLFSNLFFVLVNNFFFLPIQSRYILELIYWGILKFYLRG